MMCEFKINYFFLYNTGSPLILELNYKSTIVFVHYAIIAELRLQLGML
jgi:hypothetical protein